MTSETETVTLMCIRQQSDGSAAWVNDSWTNVYPISDFFNWPPEFYGTTPRSVLCLYMRERYRKGYGL